MIRPLEARDVPRVLDLWEALMRNGAMAEPRWVPLASGRAAVEPWVRSWVTRVPFPHGLVWDEGAVLGFVSGFPVQALAVLDRPPAARISDLFVAPEARGRGIGRALVDAFVAGARAGGHPSVEVGTLTADARAVAFWRAMGFADWQVTLRKDPA